MKIFIYKTFIIFSLILITFYLTFGFLKKEIKKELITLVSKENIEIIKNKFRSEISNSLKRENLLNKEDATLIKKYFEKLKKELN